MKIVGYIGLGIAGFVGLFLVYLVLGYTLAAMSIIALPLFKLQTQVNSAQGIINKTYDPNNAIYNYDWFKERYQAIQAIDTQIQQAQDAETSYNDALPKDRTTWGYAQQTESARLHSVVLGLQNEKQQMVAEYNARAEEANRNIFQNNLPTFIQL